MPEADSSPRQFQGPGRRAVRRGASGLCALALACALPWPATAEAPLSAIDWLSESVATPAVAAPAPPTPIDEPAVTDNALPQDVTVSVLGAPSLDALGLLSPRVTGLPAALWGAATLDQVLPALTTARTDGMPALQALLMTLLLSEADPPVDSVAGGALYMARIDKLLAMGALDQAAALIALAPEIDPALFRRSFDVALLTGDEDAGCAQMAANPALAPTLPARIFCLARGGDWNAAALTLETARALGQVSEDEDGLLSRFLDPALAEDLPQLTPPARMTPLDWRIYEAIGETFPTGTLPIAFAHAELLAPSGWKAQLEAAERLSRAGVVDPNLLAGLYSLKKPAASGGVWDRVAAFQALDAALAAGDAAAVSRALPITWAAMAQVELEIVLAAIFSERLAAIPLTGDASGVAFRLRLLSADYAEAAEVHVPADAREAFLAGLARGDLTGRPAWNSLGRAIAAAFETPTLSLETLSLITEARTGELLLRANERITSGVESDPAGVTEGLAILLRLGLADTARRVALQLMLLERRG